MAVYFCLSPWGYLGFCPLSRIFLGDYSDPYGAAFSLIQNRTDDFSSSFAPLRRKALQPSPQTFATAPANVCNRSRKRLREKPSFSICPCKYVQPSLQILASEIVLDAVHCKCGRSALKPRLQCTATQDAVHCVPFNYLVCSSTMKSAP